MSTLYGSITVNLFSFVLAVKSTWYNYTLIPLQAFKGPLHVITEGAHYNFDYIVKLFSLIFL